MEKDYPREEDKLWLTGISDELNEAKLQQFIRRFGEFAHIYRCKMKTNIFVTYLSAEDAAMAMERFSKASIRCNYAIKKNSDQSTSKNQTTSKSQYTGNTSPRNIPISNGNGVKQSQMNGLTKPVHNQRKTEIQSKKPIFRNGEEIIILHVQNNFVFYARQKSVDNEYYELLKIMNEAGKTAEKLKILPGKGDRALVPHGDGYARAIIQVNVQSKHDDVSVFLIDFGLSVNMPFHTLKVCPPEANIINIVAGFRLKGIKNKNDPYTIDCFKSFTGSTLKLECNEQIAEPQSAVKLIHSMTNLNINELINSLTIPFPFKQMIGVPPPLGNNKELTVIDNSMLSDNLITLVSETNILMFNKQHNQTQTIGMSLEKFPPYRPRLDEICLVKYNGCWYRGSFEDDQQIDNTALFLLCDFRKGIDVEKKNIRKIPIPLAKMPILTISARIDEKKLYSTDDLKHILQANKTVCVKSVSVNPNDMALSIQI